MNYSRKNTISQQKNDGQSYPLEITQSSGLEKLSGYPDNRSTAEFVRNYFSKGRMAVVEGRLQIREWTDKEGGKRRSAEVVADNVYFGDSKPKNGGENVPAFNGTPGEDAEYAVPPSGFAPDFGEEDGGLPF